MVLTCESRSHSTVLASRFAARSLPVWPRITITIIDYDHRKDAASDAELIARQQAEIEALGEELAQLTHND